MPRPPSIGDKFASRAGQKGICSQQWPQEDLPWTESGLVPDIVFNPHGFPSRMTIAMMIENMAGKSGALHGLCHDATPFRFGSDDLKDNDAIDHFGKQLEAAGYNYYGTEVLYSGNVQTHGVVLPLRFYVKSMSVSITAWKSTKKVITIFAEKLTFFPVKSTWFFFTK